METASPDLLPTSAAARQLGVTPGTVRKLVEREELSGVWIGRHLRITQTSVEDYLQRHHAGRPTPEQAS